MRSTEYFDTTISDITLALFEDSGYYQVNYYSGGLFKFGKNEGRNFFNKKCIINGVTSFPNEFCTNYDEESCTNTRINKGYCLIYQYSRTIPSKYRYFSNERNGGFYPANYCPVTNVYSSLKNEDYYPTSCNYGTSNVEEDYGEGGKIHFVSLVHYYLYLLI